MSKTLVFLHKPDGVLVDADVVTLFSVTDTYGIKRKSDDSVVVASGTSMTRTALGTYEYTFSDDANLLETHVASIFTTYLTDVVYYVQELGPEDVYAYEGRYCTTQDLIDQYARDNVTQWAVLDSTSEAQTLARVTRAIDDAEDFIDDYLRGGVYEVPFVTVIPNRIRLIAALLAGVYLYESRGTLDINPDFGTPQHRLQYQRKRATSMLSRVKSGMTVLLVADDDVTSSTVPKIGTDYSDTNNCEC